MPDRHDADDDTEDVDVALDGLLRRLASPQAESVAAAMSPSQAQALSDAESGARLIADRYQVLEELGRGGMGTVYRARHTGTRGLVAIKMLRGRATPAAKRQFEAEARNAATLTHPHTVRVFDYGYDEASGLPWLVMELVPGRPLDIVLEANPNRRLRWGRVVQIARQILGSLAEAHAHRRCIVHRDVKPANILLVERTGEADVARLVDFGIAVGLHDVDEGRGMAGTPSMMAPEQFVGPDTTPSADLYSLGCTLFTLLVGHPPFSAESLEGWAAQHATAAPPSICAVVPDVPAKLAAWIETRLMAKAAADRPSDAGAALRELGELHPRGSAPGATEVTLPTLRPRLPVPAHPLVEREPELNGLLDIVASGTGLITVVGPGGVGKTRLCVELLARHAQQGGTSWFADLSAATDGDDIVRSLADAMGLRAPSADQRAQIGATLNAEPSSVLVLDNFEHLTEYAQSVGAWLAVAPGARIVVTSREPLALPRERVVRLEPLALPEPSAGIKAASRCAAVQLFVARAREARPGFELTDDNAGDVVRLVRELDGLPLALELAAARLRIMTPSAMLARIERRFELLQTRTRQRSDRHSALEATIAWSWELLDAAEQAALAQCGVFRGGFSLDAAEAVIALPDGASVIDVVESLVARSLVRVVSDPQDADSRFDLLFSIRAFAEARLRDWDPRERGLVLSRHAAYFARFGADQTLLEVLRLRTRHRVLDTEGANLRVVLDRGRDAAASVDHVVGCALAIAGGLLLNGSVVEGCDMLDRLLDEPELTPRQRTRLLGWSGLFRVRVGPLDRARSDLLEAVELARAGSDPYGEGYALHELGIAHKLMGETSSAREAFAAAERIGVEIGDQSLECTNRRDLAMLLLEGGDVEGARSSYERALQMAIRVGDRRQQAHIRLGIAGLEGSDGRNATARDMALDVVADAQGLGDLLLQSTALQVAGDASARLHDSEGARQLFTRALAVAMSQNDAFAERRARAALDALDAREGTT